MFHIVLVEPEIPPNTGNVIRLAANTGCSLHLIEPLGFSMEDKHMRRAGLDYHEYARPAPPRQLDGVPAGVPAGRRPPVRADHPRQPWRARRGVPTGRLAGFWRLRRAACPNRCAMPWHPTSICACPCVPGQRSLNLSNAVAVTVFEAWRQNAFVTVQG
jgi:tRNA (cytidine/uridine-2'-O-)-methyltransferase